MRSFFAAALTALMIELGLHAQIAEEADGLRRAAVGDPRIRQVVAARHVHYMYYKDL